MFRYRLVRCCRGGPVVVSAAVELLVACCQGRPSRQAARRAPHMLPRRHSFGRDAGPYDRARQAPCRPPLRELLGLAGRTCVSLFSGQRRPTIYGNGSSQAAPVCRPRTTSNASPFAASPVMSQARRVPPRPPRPREHRCHPPRRVPRELTATSRPLRAIGRQPPPCQLRGIGRRRC